MKGYRSTVIAAALCMWLFSAYSYAASEKDREVTLMIPAKVLQEFINEVMPVELTDHDKISGDLRIRSIEDLKLGLNKAWFTTTIHGENIAYKDTIGGLPANLRFGALDSTLHCEASIRYESDKGLLYIRPTIVDQVEKGNALWLLLVSLLSEEEYPLEIQKLKPIAARVSDKTVDIDMDISDIYTANGRLFIVVSPDIRAVKE